ncbi:hypothetical protein AB0C02_33005 [Micromonospora sp. NPDC048999]|uniref:hypothetical protein n=1 Tax=Micromonospora sp. NPDC048999 TaxID=3155391 RepID=UPI0033D5C105
MTTAAEFVDKLRRSKARSGLSYRSVQPGARRLRDVLPTSTISSALNRDSGQRGTIAGTPTARSAYLAQLEAQTRWLADEGKKAASMLEGLYNAYASLGYQHIGTLISALKSYVQAVNGLFSSCSNPEKAFLDTVHTFVTYLLDAENSTSKPCQT